jgi:ABC-2 type transport system permease protein
MTQNTIKLTLIQKLLGRNYKWWYLCMQGYKSNTAYRFNSLGWLAGSIVLVIGTLVVWYINYTQQGALSSDFREIFTYFIVGEGCIFVSAIQFDLGEDIQSGKISNRLLLPTDTFLAYSIYQFGYQLFENVSKFVIYLLLALILNQFLILASYYVFFAFALSIVFAYLINVLTGIIIGASAFYLTAFFGAASFFDSLKLIFGGRLFPFDKLAVLKPLIFTHFAFTFYHPMQIYLGKYDLIQTILVFLGGVTWCIILYFLAKFIFKLGLKRNEAVGL